LSKKAQKNLAAIKHLILMRFSLPALGSRSNTIYGVLPGLYMIDEWFQIGS
jgi:hypothetical protein